MYGCSFFKALHNNSIFKETYKDIWNENLQNLEAVTDFMQSEGLKLENSYELNRIRWQCYWYPEDYRELISNMMEWYSERLSWLNSQISTW